MPHKHLMGSGWQQKRTARGHALEILESEEATYIFKDQVESKGEEVLIQTLPEVDMNQGDVLRDPKVKSRGLHHQGYEHPNYSIYCDHFSRRLSELTDYLRLRERPTILVTCQR